MAFTQITTSVSILNSGLVGFNGVSFINFDNTGEPAIASGSSIEIAGAFFKADSDVSITNWAGITTGLSCYIALTPSGSAGAQTLAAAYTTTVPVWVTDKNGWYASAASNVRYVGTVYKYATADYFAKRVLGNGQKTLGGVNVATNYAVGSMALYTLTTGLHNIAIGDYALQLNTTGSRNVAIGHASLNENTTGVDNVAIGLGALHKNTVGTANVAIGYYTLSTNTEGNNNIAIGSQAMKLNTTGGNNVAIGWSTLYDNTVGELNVAVGYSALADNTTAKYNVAVGAYALGFNTTGYGNIGIGFSSSGKCTTGYYNIGIGHYSSYYNLTGWGNVALGYQSLYNNIANQNVAVGYQALTNLWDSSGNINTAIGYHAGENLVHGTNNSFLGYNADYPATTFSNMVTLGDGGVTVLRCQVTSITALSDKRDKTLIHDISLGVDFINALTPVEFNWDRRDWYENKTPDGTKIGKKDYGFIAQDLLAIQEKFNAPWLDLVLQVNSERLETSTGKLMPVVIKAIQELSNEIQMLKEKINA